MAKDVLVVLNDLIKRGVVSAELLPDIISRYSELKLELDRNPYSESFRQIMKSVDSYLGENIIPSSEILLLGAAINLVKIEKSQQSQKIDFFSFLPSMGMKKCSKCSTLNVVNAKFCYFCGSAFQA